jgi:hypothetical protein
MASTIVVKDSRGDTGSCCCEGRDNGCQAIGLVGTNGTRTHGLNATRMKAAALSKEVAAALISDAAFSIATTISRFTRWSSFGSCIPMDLGLANGVASGSKG